MIVVNFATVEYVSRQRRLKRSLIGRSSLLFNQYNQIGSPKHQESPYEFKIHAIEKGFLQDDIVLWVDASMWLVGDLRKVENHIKTDGYFMEEAGAWVGHWTNEFTREYFNLTEEELKVPGGLFMFSAGFLGLNKQNPTAMEWFRQWKAAALAGCFKGTWEDHRHDMTCGSIIAQRMGLKFHAGGKHLAYIGAEFPNPGPDVVFKLKGTI